MNSTVSNDSWTNDTEHNHSSSGSRDPLSIVNMVFGMTGCCGNLFVLLVLISYKNARKKVTNKFVINQSLIDALASFFVFIDFAVTKTSRVLNHSSLGDRVFCSVWYLATPKWALMSVSSYSVTVLTADRYLAVVHPIFYKTKMKGPWVYGLIAFSWSLPMLYTAILNFGLSDVSNGQCVYLARVLSNSAYKIFGSTSFALQFCIPFTLMTVFYTRMIAVLRRRSSSTEPTRKMSSIRTGSPETNKEIRAQNSSEGKAPSTMERARMNILKTMILVSLCFVFCQSWNQIYYYLYILDVHHDISSPFYNFTVMARFFYSVANPIIYTVKYRDFQQGLRRCFGLCCLQDTRQKSAGRETMAVSHIM